VRHADTERTHSPLQSDGGAHLKHDWLHRRGDDMSDGWPKIGTNRHKKPRQLTMEIDRQVRAPTHPHPSPFAFPLVGSSRAGRGSGVPEGCASFPRIFL
jgi:hypothetical protein